MACFNTHLSVGITASGVLSLGALSLGMIEPAMVIPAFLLATLGSLLPDIDADHSTPLQIAFTALSIVGAFLLALWSRVWFDELWQVLLVWLGSYLAVRWGVFHLFTRYTVHRGIIHSLPVALLFGSLVTSSAFWIFEVSAWPAWVAGLALSCGFLIHLLLDEVSSVNLFGIRSRRSFGTAFKLWYGKDLRASLLAWVLLAVSLPLLPPAGELPQRVEQGWQGLVDGLEALGLADRL